MVEILEEFYQISERDPDQVSSTWKVFHIVLFIVAAVCGFVTCFSFNLILEDFRYSCVLNAHVLFLNASELDVGNSTLPTVTPIEPTILPNTTGTEESDEPIENITSKSAFIAKTQYKLIDATHTIWGSQDACNFSQFTPLVSMICAIIWGTFFVIVAKGGAGFDTDILPKPWKIVCPCIIFCLVFSIVLAVSTFEASNGILHFCKEFKSQFGNSECVEAINVYTRQFNPVERNFYLHQDIANRSAYIGFFAWVFQLVFLIIRVISVVDFKVQRVRIAVKDGEVVQSVIEFQDEDLLDKENISQV